MKDIQTKPCVPVVILARIVILAHHLLGLLLHRLLPLHLLPRKPLHPLLHTLLRHLQSDNRQANTTAVTEWVLIITGRGSSTDLRVR